MRQSEHNKVTVAKNSATAATAQTANEKMLYLRCMELSIGKLKLIVRQMFDNADTTLTSLAEKSGQATEAIQYTEAMRMVRMQRANLENSFLDLVKQNFTDTHAAKKTADIDFTKISLEGICLVEEVDLEESIAIKNMISKTRYQYAEEISALDKRLALLLHDTEWDESNNPLGPEKLCHAFAKVASSLAAGPKIGLIILKLFEIHMLNDLEPLYLAVNQLCIDAGILPRIKLMITKTPDQLSASPSGAGQSGPGGYAGNNPMMHVSPGMPGASAAAIDTSLSYLHSLLSQYRQTNFAGYPMGNNAPLLPVGQPGADQAPINWNPGQMSGAMFNGGQLTVSTSDELAAILSSMQFFNMPQGNPAAAGMQAGDAVTMIPRGGLKQYVLSNLEKQGQASAALQPLDNDVIDIVSMLFEYILDDDNIPDAAKALLGKLQIPLLKAAILDKEFFSSKDHPARTLLNEMAKSTLAITDTCSDDAVLLLSELKRIVEKIIAEFAEDLTVFVTLLEEFQVFMARQTAVENIVQQKVAAKSKQKEDYTLAKNWVDEALNTALEQRNLPPAVKDIILGPWQQVMLKTYLNQGQDSDTWKNQLRFIEILDWSIQPKRISMDRSKLATVIYHLVSTLRNGLDTIGIPADEITRTLAQLEPYHFASIKGLRHQKSAASNSTIDPMLGAEATAQYLFPTEQASRDKAVNQQKDTTAVAVNMDMSLDEITGTIHEIESQLAALAQFEEQMAQESEPVNTNVDAKYKEFMDDIVLSGDESRNADALDQIQDKYLEQARQLEQGKWVEFTGKENRKVRGKLAWKSELLGEFTFLDWKYSVVADKTLYGLAADLRRGSAVVIDDIPIMDRALSAVMQTLTGNAKR